MGKVVVLRTVSRHHRRCRCIPVHCSSSQSTDQLRGSHQLADTCLVQFLLADDGVRNAQAPPASSDYRYPQACRSESLDGESPTFSYSFNTNLQLLNEHDRALLSKHHRVHARRQLCLCGQVRTPTFMALRNAQPTRYVWNAKGENILKNPTCV